MKLLHPVLLLASFGALGGRASIVDDIVNALESVVECGACHDVLLPLVQTLAHLGNDDFVSAFASICKLIGAADDDVCEGELARTGPIIAHSLRSFKASGTTATKFCEAVFGLCQQPAVTAYSVPFSSSAPSNPTQFVSKGRTPFQVVHFSDVHIDRSYTVGAEASCTKPICCRNFADHTGAVTTAAQPFGNSKCDSPVDLAASFLSAVGTIGKGAKFAIFTGDVEEGDTWLVDKADVTADLKAFNDQLASAISLPVYPAIGEHDAAPVNSFPRSTTKTTIDSQWVFDTQGAGWEQWIGGAAADQVTHTSGSYSAVVPDTNLRILSMNTNYWYKQNFWLYDSKSQIADPNGLFAFMTAQLQAAEDAGQRVWITGHIPSGKSDFPHDQSNYYDQIVQRYKNTIAAQFFGHSHKDEFEIAYSDWSNKNADTADSILFVAPALTPTSGNPAFKVYDVDPDTYEVMDMKVYYTDVSAPSFQTSPTWGLYYSARDTWGPLVGLSASAPLDASFWHKLTEVFETNSTAFQLYNTHLTRGGKVSTCDGACATKAICNMRAARAENSCDVTTPGISFKRGLDKHAHVEDDACEGGAIGSIMRNMVGGRKLVFNDEQ
ncbi:sphingomyelin phosphodiesterase [Amylostereum chailletii]|nr:sphingomyelin phosphodiesterase [Amylostereum chailletii]